MVMVTITRYQYPASGYRLIIRPLPSRSLRLTAGAGRAATLLVQL